MSDTEFRHDWEPHYWRSAVKQRLVGYRSCRNCGRGEWLSGDVQPSDKMSEADCQAMLDTMVGRPQFIQLQLFTDGFA